jgi:hypothetical protein
VLVVPVLITIMPDDPIAGLGAAEASAVAIHRAPLVDELAPVPLNSDTRPPVADPDLPALNTSSPPTPLLPDPTITYTEPPRPELAAPEPTVIDPLETGPGPVAAPEEI